VIESLRSIGIAINTGIAIILTCLFTGCTVIRTFPASFADRTVSEGTVVADEGELFQLAVSAVGRDESAGSTLASHKCECRMALLAYELVFRPCLAIMAVRDGLFTRQTDIVLLVKAIYTVLGAIGRVFCQLEGIFTDETGAEAATFLAVGDIADWLARFLIDQLEAIFAEFTSDGRRTPVAPMNITDGSAYS
jgi:hypothetical protein